MHDILQDTEPKKEKGFGLGDTINMHVNLHTNSGIFKYAGGMW